MYRELSSAVDTLIISDTVGRTIQAAVDNMVQYPVAWLVEKSIHVRVDAATYTIIFASHTRATQESHGIFGNE